MTLCLLFGQIPSESIMSTYIIICKVFTVFDVLKWKEVISFQVPFNLDIINNERYICLYTFIIWGLILYMIKRNIKMI